MTAKKALYCSAFWVVAACFFNLGIYLQYGAERASMFMNVYLVEKLLSFDNLFVFLLIFTYFNVPDKQRRTVLNWGILGAIVLRALFIGAGVGLVQQFHWILYGLGVLLIYSAWGIAFGGDDDADVSNSRIVKFAKSLSIPPLLMWIIAIELSDIAFAIDSIPVALSITQDMIIIFTANIFAILGLRSFYFVIQSLYDVLPQLKYGIAAILSFIGIKMFLPLIKLYISPTVSLGVVVSILLVNVIYILIKRK